MNIYCKDGPDFHIGLTMQNIISVMISLMMILALSLFSCNGATSESKSQHKPLSASDEIILPKMAIDGLVQTIIRFNCEYGLEGLNLKTYFPPIPPLISKDPVSINRYQKLTKKSEEINSRIESSWKERKFVIIVVVDKSLYPESKTMCEGYTIKIVNTFHRPERIYHNTGLEDLISEYEKLLTNPVVVVYVSTYKQIGIRRTYFQIYIDYGIPLTGVMSEVFLVYTKSWEVKKVNIIERS